MRKIVIILGLILIICSLTAIILETRYRDDIRVQRLFARFFIGSDQRLLDTADTLREKAAPDSLNQAIALYREALSRDAANPYRWCDLGLALLDEGRAEEARRCYERAVELGPNNIQTLWRVVEFYTRVKQPREALRCASRIIQKDPGAAEPVFYAYQQPDFDFPDTLSHGIPAEKSAAQAYLRYLMRYGDVLKAEQCWNWVAAHSFADDKLAGEYAAFVIRIGEPGKARDVWAAYLGERKGSYLQSNILYTAGFEA